MMRLGAEKTIRQILELLRSPGGLVQLKARAVGLCLEPGATMDALALQGRTRHADAATTGLYLLPAAATMLASVLRLDFGGLLAAMTADLLAVSLLPTVIALAMPGLCQLFDIEAEGNTARWRTFLSHALVPALLASAGARLLVPFSWIFGFALVTAGYLATARLFWLCCDDWVSVPETKRLQTTAAVAVSLVILGLASAVFFRAGLIP